MIHPSRKVLQKADNLYTNESLVPSLGLASIGAYCRQNQIEAKIIDLRLAQQTIKNMLNYIEEKHPVLIGITAFTAEIVPGAKIAQIVKEKFPEMPVIVGGPHVSVIPQETLKEFRSFDVGVIGEGEKPLLKLVDIFSEGKGELEKLEGIVFRKDGEVVTNQMEAPISDINNLPLPAWDLFELKHYKRIFPVSTSRGCPYRCYFCTPNYLGDRVRVKNYSNIVKEIEWLVDKFSAQRVQFADATLGLLREDALLMCEELIRRDLNRRIKWDCETRADSVSFNLLKKMKEAGCEWVAFGVETGSERILKEVVQKGESKEQIRNAVDLARRAGIKVRCFFILGHYGETRETIKETIDFALELNPDALSFGLMVPNPGTKIRKLAEEGKNGLKIRHNRWEDYQQFNYDCFELENLPLAELKKWQSNAYFTFYRHHPVKALSLFFERSAYNYRPSALLRIPFSLLKNLRCQA